MPLMLLAASAAVRAEAGDSLRSVDALHVVDPPALLPLLAVLLLLLLLQLLLLLLLLLLLSLPHTGGESAAVDAPAATAASCRRRSSPCAPWYMAKALFCSDAARFLSPIACLLASM